MTLSDGGLAALPGAVAVLIAGGAWWKAVERNDAWREHTLPAGALLLLAPPLLRALWAAAGLGEGPLPASLSPVAASAPAWWSAIALLVGSALLAWRATAPVPTVAAGAMLCVALLSPAAAHAQEVEVTPVFGPHQRPGRFLPVAIEVRSGTVPLVSEVRLSVDGGPDVAVPVELPANGRMRQVVPVTVQGSVARVTVRGGWQPEEAEPLAQLRLRRPGAGTALVLSLSGNADEGRRFQMLESESRTLIPCAPGRLPARAEYFEMVDCCVVGGIGEGSLTPSAAAALAEWVVGGGRLLLTDPDLLRRSPELDRALFDARGADESLSPAIPGLPGHFAQALRRRGLGPRDVVYDTAGRPHHIRFRSGQGGGALLLAPIHHADGRTAMSRLLGELATPRDLPVPTLAGTAIGAFPPAAPGGWPRAALAIWLLLVPLLGVAWSRSRTLAGAAAVVVALIAAWLGVASTAPVAQVVNVTTVGDGHGTEQVVHVASARRSSLTLQLADHALPRPLVRRTGELSGGQGVVEWGDAPAWREWLVKRGTSRAATLAPATRPDLRLLAVRAGRRLLVSNESGVPLTACLLAWQGRMLDLGSFNAGEVRSVEMPERLPGPLHVLDTIGERHGVTVARALRVARARLPRGGMPLLLAATHSAIHAAPEIAGASSTALPSVLVARVTGR